MVANTRNPYGSNGSTPRNQKINLNSTVKDRRHTINYDELASWRKDNHDIQTGYRRELPSYRLIVHSLFAYWHNETSQFKVYAHSLLWFLANDLAQSIFGHISSAHASRWSRRLPSPAGTISTWPPLPRRVDSAGQLHFIWFIRSQPSISRASIGSTPWWSPFFSPQLRLVSLSRPVFMHCLHTQKVRLSSSKESAYGTDKTRERIEVSKRFHRLDYIGIALLISVSSITAHRSMQNWMNESYYIRERLCPAFISGSIAMSIWNISTLLSSLSQLPPQSISHSHHMPLLPPTEDSGLQFSSLSAPPQFSPSFMAFMYTDSIPPTTYFR